MKLAVLIPAHNEEPSIGEVLLSIPHTLPGIHSILRIVIDDGSTDATADRAAASGALVCRHNVRRGLACAFRTGLSAALSEGADFIATLDGDGQYKSEELGLLLSRLTTEKADLVVGDRQIGTLTHMPPAYRIGNSIGSSMLRVLGLTRVKDASSGFRMFTRKCAEELRITSAHTYTHEMLIQASAAGMRITETPVTFLPRKYGRSKLVRTLRHHILRSCGTILRALFLYRPLPKFLFLAALCFGFALLLIAPVLSRALTPSEIAPGIVFLVLSVQFVILGLIADAQAAHRMLRVHVSPSRT